MKGDLTAASISCLKLGPPSPAAKKATGTLDVLTDWMGEDEWGKAKESERSPSPARLQGDGRREEGTRGGPGAHPRVQGRGHFPQRAGAFPTEGRGRFRMLMGGLGKGMDFSMLEPMKKQMAGAYLFGASREEIAGVLAGVSCQDFGTDFEAAVRAAVRAAEPGDVVLLAPGCASMDMFKDYRERGDRFRDCVLREV